MIFWYGCGSIPLTNGAESGSRSGYCFFFSLSKMWVYVNHIFYLFIDSATLASIFGWHHLQALPTPAWVRFYLLYSSKSISHIMHLSYCQDLVHINEIAHVSYFFQTNLWWMRSNQVVRASDCRCKSRNSLVFDPSILRQWNLRGGRWSSIE